MHGGDANDSSAGFGDFRDLAIEIGLGEGGQAKQEAQGAHTL